MANNIYVLQEDVRVFDNGKTEFRLRRGVWNYEEAEIDINSFSEPFQHFFRKLIDALCAADGFSVSAIEESNLGEDEKENLRYLLTQLEAGNYILDIVNRDLNRELSRALLGYGLMYDRGTTDIKDIPRVLVITDSSHAKDNADKLANTMNLDISFADENDLSVLINSDLTTKTDGLTTEDTMAKLKEKYGSYHVFLVCIQQISSKLMHALNRLSVESNIPMVVSFLDGPMISVLSIKPHGTGCYECFENRSLARIQDHVLFHQFELHAKKQKIRENACMIPVMNFLINISLVECYLFAYYGASRFEGRLLSIFIPTLEIQVQDVLRVPFCPACGVVADEQLREKNISTRNLIDHFVENAIIKSTVK